MADQKPTLFHQLVEILKPSAETSLALLDSEQAHIFTTLNNDAIDILTAVVAGTAHDEFRGSVVWLDFSTIPQQLIGMEFDFICARYDEVRRGLRFAWELMARAYYADCLQSMWSSEADRAGPELADKLEWLANREDGLNWKTVILPVLEQLFPTDSAEDLKSHFRPLWQRLNQAVHASAQTRLDGTGEYMRLYRWQFDEAHARQVIADAREIFAIVFVIVLKRFPHIATKLSTSPNAFQGCPIVRSFLPPVRPNPSLT